MKTVEKKTMDEAIRLSRKYWDTGDVDILPARLVKTRNLSEQAFGNDWKWCKFNDLIDSMIGLNKGVGNVTIYEALALVGITVTEEKAEEIA
jgi:hypothetical protein